MRDDSNPSCPRRDPPMPERRDLHYGSLNEVMPDVDRLLRGYTTVGRWSLGQVCRHLAEALRLTVEGKPIRGYGWLRWTIGPLIRGRFLRNGRMPSGLKMPTASLAPPPGLDDRAEAEALRASLRYFLTAELPNRTHPILGTLSPQQWRRFHCIHCAHHLSFVLPT